MKIKLFDYHTQALDHGFNKPLRVEETVKAAIDKKLSAICLTDHFPLPNEFGDPTDEKDCTMNLSRYPTYLGKVKKTKQKFMDKIEILFGAEFDWLPNYQVWIEQQMRAYMFDYVIGSVHFLGIIKDKNEKRNFIIDYTKEEFEKGLSFHKDIQLLIEKYYLELQSMARSKLFDSVGHFDLIKKYNDGNLFSQAEQWYKDLVLKTLDVIADAKRVLEINTSGWDKVCKEQYPSLWILKEAQKRNIKITIGSDAHIPENIGKNLDKAIQIAKLAGYDSLVRFKKRKILEVKI
ncbi:histidinol-phosphatase HisJ [Candidatus Gottesmanbacteria bacterium]|nr:histidinol-phosphatase HisJ [Candidatus Gottesmanbacteria bacterium]